MSTARPEIRLVVFDLAGTTLDFGSLAPLAAFVEAFAHHQIAVTTAEARAPMGLNKKDHVRAMLAMPAVAERWRLAHGRDWNEGDVLSVYQHFMPLQMKSLDRHSKLVPGMKECLAELRGRGIKIATTTGFFPDAAARVNRLAREQGFSPDISKCAGDAAEGRPAPFMIFRIMEALRIHSVATVLKVGDTVPDIEEGLNAGAWTAGVVASSSDVGCSEQELAALDETERQNRFAATRAKLQAAGAHAILDTIAQVPELVAVINAGTADSRFGFSARTEPCER